ncbi:mannose-1-phosphate guanylyltransferase [Leptospira noumeaensis]|uniref:mannose-1-phosphate guanylyltransferase n=1 Tax=Leptospira noumeaensis TaxID=2484964 RepID=A0A4R9I950_9LEPT|nr:sugar phosphate nucleotidyltransferase [Leptospira noumeaensis]TGK82306.1 mannose-1-phosphate guanylyltransferase [Leptospira noumeaensis]
MAKLPKESPVVLIMAGGKGERFWPRSRTNSPKQLQKVYSNKTLLRETIDRALTITTIDRIYIGTNANLKAEILKKDPKFPSTNFILEPEGKNTAPIIALSALYFQKKFGNPNLIVLSADAFIDPIKEFTRTIEQALYETENGMVLLGVKPNRPEVGYGYISTGKPTDVGYTVKAFFEKPDFKTALKYIKKKNFYWNPGIFLFRTETILSELERHAPHILGPLKNGFPFKNFGDLKTAFQMLPSEAIDTAIMEKSNRIRMVEATFNWDDVGSWMSLERILPGDKDKNHHQGKEVLYHKASGNISSVQKELITFLGVKDLIVVEEPDVLLVTSREGVGDIKAMLSTMRKNKVLQKYLD